MGVVYVGQHETLSRRVAVKVLRREMSSGADMLRRFFNEAQAATAIHSPGIVQVFDFGTTSDGSAFIVMDLLEGETLTARLKQRRLSAVECCRLGRQIANVLQAAHERGITHRDLKPDNLFLVPDREVLGGERIKVLDFGIAKLASELHAAGVKTGTQVLMGTPKYMSPKQCRGAVHAEPRSDIYSLGCILFEMACGHPPFAGGLGDIIAAHLHTAPRHPLDLEPDIPPSLADLIINLLAKQPSARPQTMAAVSQAFDEILRTLDAPPHDTPTPLPDSDPTLPSAPASQIALTLPPDSTLSPASASPPVPALPRPGLPGLMPSPTPELVRPKLPDLAPSPTPGLHQPPMPPRAHTQPPLPLPSSPHPPAPVPAPRATPITTPSSPPSGLPPHARPTTPLPVPPSTPQPAPPPVVARGPQLTPIRGSAKGSRIQPHTRPHRLRFVLGSLIASGVVTAIAFATEAPTPTERESSYHDVINTPSQEEVAIIPDGTPPPPIPAPPPKGPADGTESKPPSPGPTDVEPECQSYLEERKWADLEQCADRLQTLDPTQALKLKIRATEEAKAVLQIAAVEAALLAKNLKLAKAEIASIWPESVAYTSIKRKYDVAEEQAITDLATNLRRVKTPDCKAYEALLAKERNLSPPRVTTEAARQTPCSPAACTGEARAQRGQELYALGRLAEAFKSYEAAYACSPIPQWAEKAFIIGCNLGDLPKAKLYWKRLPSNMRSRALGICVRNGFTEATLNAREYSFKGISVRPTQGSGTAGVLPGWNGWNVT